MSGKKPYKTSGLSSLAVSKDKMDFVGDEEKSELINILYQPTSDGMDLTNKQRNSGIGDYTNSFDKSNKVVEPPKKSKHTYSKSTVLGGATDLGLPYINNNSMLIEKKTNVITSPKASRNNITLQNNSRQPIKVSNDPY